MIKKLHDHSKSLLINSEHLDPQKAVVICLSKVSNEKRREKAKLKINAAAKKLAW